MTPAGSSGEPGSSSEQAEALQPISHGHKRDGAERPGPAVLVLAGQRQMPAAMPSGPPHLHSAASCLARCVTPPTTPQRTSERRLQSRRRSRAPGLPLQPRGCFVEGIFSSRIVLPPWCIYLAARSLLEVDILPGPAVCVW